MKVNGRAIILGANVDTDQIYPGRYLPITEPEEMAEHVFEGIIPDFREKAKGAIIVAGKNFGCGSSREQAATSLKHSGIAGIIAESFARIFFRNAINQGLSVIIAQGIVDRVRDGDLLRADLKEGLIRDVTRDLDFRGEPLPDFLLDIIKKGGLIESIRIRLGGRK